MNLILLALLLAAIVAAGLWLVWRAIGGEPGRHADCDEFDWRPRPRFGRGTPDRLDRLMSEYAVPRPLLEELLATDRFIADADARLHVDRQLAGIA